MKTKKPTFSQKEKCHGCDKQLYDLPVEAVLTKHKFCSRECLHTNYFKFPSLQNHHHEQQQEIHIA
jgi:hypothetical protein